MFTGIIETTGTIESIKKNENNITFIIKTPIAKECKIGESISHNGVCLTIEEIISSELYQVTVIQETLSKTNLGLLQIGHLVNLERSLPANGRIDGHFVQGHVDCTGIVYNSIYKEGSYEFQILYPEEFRNLIIPRGSIAIDGISLTISKIEDTLIPKRNIFNLQEFLNAKNYLSLFVNIIPHTYKITNIKKWQKGTIVNLEFDILGKYFHRIISK